MIRPIKQSGTQRKTVMRAAAAPDCGGVSLIRRTGSFLPEQRGKYVAEIMNRGLHEEVGFPPLFFSFGGGLRWEGRRVLTVS
jgi:hypothetical protein